MATLGFDFKADDYQNENSFDALPAGWYQVKVESAEVKATKAGTGKYISVGYKVTGENYNGRMVFGNLNIQNPNPEAERIGRQQLGDLCRAIGIAGVQDTNQLIGGNCMVNLNVRKSEEYGDSNDIKSWKAIEGAAAPTGGAGTGGDSRPPWAK